MFDAKICCFFAKAPQWRFSVPFSLQPKPLQPDYVSSDEYFKETFREYKGPPRDLPFHR